MTDQTIPPVRRSQLELCARDACAAYVLCLFEQEYMLIKSLNEKRERVNAEYAAKGLPVEPLISYWMAYTKDEIRRGLLELYSVNSISAALEKLLAWGFIERRNDPLDPMNRKYQYLYLESAINAMIAHNAKLENAISKTDLSHYLSIEEDIDKEKENNTISQNCTMGSKPILGVFNAQKVNAPLQSTGSKEKHAPLNELEQLIQDSSTGLGLSYQKAVRKSLTEIVQTKDGKQYPSPAELWESNPKFKEYVLDRLTWAKNQSDRPCKRLVALIRLYDTPKYGWIDFEAGAALPASDSTPTLPTVSDAEMDDYFRSLSGQ